MRQDFLELYRTFALNECTGDGKAHQQEVLFSVTYGGFGTSTVGTGGTEAKRLMLLLLDY